MQFSCALLDPELGRLGRSGTDSGTAAKSKSLGFTGFGTVGRPVHPLNTPKAPPPFIILILIIIVILILIVIFPSLLLGFH